jgi:hypothetical protein
VEGGWGYSLNFDQYQKGDKMHVSFIIFESVQEALLSLLCPREIVWILDLV